MQTVTSADGTTIAYDRVGEGTAGTVILIGGAFSHREFPTMVELAQTLATDFDLTVLNYDRRGRGDSADSPGVYNVANEIADIAALVEVAGGEAALFGWSSGAVLALLAAANVPGVTEVMAFEPPFVVDPKHHVPPQDLETKLHPMIAAGKRNKTVRYYMSKAMGMPWLMVSAMRVTPFWKSLAATSNSTAHDWAVMKPYMRGRKLDPADWSGVTVPVLVLAGDRTALLLATAAKAAAAALPNAEFVELPGMSHNPKISVLAPAAGEFLTRAK
ncbi:alpha/beta fold hydrolase [Nocardia asteroides]|uniref:alpha/beta fold hydrolase n=1 Tax=Nocardia asteroides TaxID=1824 RepID=UPI001E4D2D6E|nr:alpha/beta hydrolase [Nocardia asteroides]UGT58250.1 alpha/beta hydrolase [Nocardia asteroides]